MKNKHPFPSSGSNPVMQTQRIGKWVRRHGAGLILEAILLMICIGLALKVPQFLTAVNLTNVLYSVSMQGLIAFGMTMVIIAGEIDLSVGSAVALSGCLTAYLHQLGVPIPLAILASVIVGFGFGSFSGFMRTKYQVPSFITTLALYTGLKGAAFMITDGFPLTPFPQWYSYLGAGRILGVPVPVAIFLVGFVAIHFLMNYTSFGRSVYAVGGNAAAARLCGINVPLVRILILAITGAFAAISGVLLSARIMSGTPTVATGWELDVIAAVIIGGTSFTGGVGRVWGTLIGIIFIGVIINGMTLLNVPIYTQNVIRGLLILAAVLMNRLQDRSTAH